MKRNVLALTVLLALLLGAITTSAPGNALAASRAESHAHIFDKTRFAFHLGLAYFAFHHFVYAPYKSGEFKKGAPHRTLRIVKAGAALLVTYHELQKAYDIAKGSNSHILQVLVKPLTGLINQANSVKNKISSGQYSDQEVASLTNAANSFSKQATSGGISIKDIPVPGL